jgi:hypothetical protein
MLLAGRFGVQIQVRARVSFSKSSRPPLGPTQPVINRHRGPFPGVKRPGRDVNHSPSSVEVKNEWSYTSTPIICLHGVDMDNFIFYIK